MKNLIKSILKKLYFDIIVRRKNERKARLYLSGFLKKGIYFFPKNENTIKSLNRSAFRLQNILHIHRLGAEGAELSTIKYNLGQGKIIAYIDDKVKGFFFTEKGFHHAKSTFEKYFGYFNYPCAGIYSFDESDYSISMEYIEGRPLSGSEYDLKVTELLLNCATTARLYNENGQTMYLQHADAARRNLLCKDDNTLLFIDLDNIGPFPPLFDVFYYLNQDYSLEQILEILNKHDCLLKQITERCGFSKDADIYDELFYGYCYAYRNMPEWFGNFKFLSIENTVKYPKTYELLLQYKRMNK